MPLAREDVMRALARVEDPDLHKDLVTLGMVKGVDLDGSCVNVSIELTTPACPMKDRIRGDIEREITVAARSAGLDSPQITVAFTAQVRSAAATHAGTPLEGVAHVIAVGAGKGGVGKSSVSVNLAVGLARMGAKVGLLDGDIYGPSLPTMLGLDDLRGTIRGEMLVPFEVHGIKAITIGKLVDADKPLIWRGPMAHGAFKQLITQTLWGTLDYLVVDLPPGTGDVPLTLAQLIPLSGAVIVCTPQRVAQDDARRAVRMFQQLNVEILGVVENMSSFVGDDGKEYDLFGKGGAKAMAESMELPFLGAIPISMALRRNADAGTPLANWAGSPQLGQALDGVCSRVASELSIRAARGRLMQPTLSVAGRQKG